MLGFYHCGGYYYNDTHIRAFSHTHLVGAGIADFGNLGVTVTRSISNETITDFNYRSKFSHENETGRVGKTSVFCEINEIEGSHLPMDIRILWSLLGGS